ncbi:MAG: OsmC family protein, partial [Pseudomonadota bacterium]
VGGLTGCLMTQVRAFAKRLKIELTDLRVETRVEWSWTPTGKTYETAPKAFEIDVIVESDAPHSDVVMLLETAKKGCFIEQTLGQRNTIRHRLKTKAGYIDV